MEVTDISPALIIYARGNATHAYQPSKMERFTREVAYTPGNNVLVIFDRVRTTDPEFQEGLVAAWRRRTTVDGSATREEMLVTAALPTRTPSTFTYEDGEGRLRVHSLLPREREVDNAGGPGWEFWTPGDEFGGAWGSGKNWPLDPPAGGPLPPIRIFARCGRLFGAKILKSCYLEYARGCSGGVARRSFSGKTSERRLLSTCSGDRR